VIGVEAVGDDCVVKREALLVLEKDEGVDEDDDEILDVEPDVLTSVVDVVWLEVLFEVAGVVEVDDVVVAVDVVAVELDPLRVLVDNEEVVDDVEDVPVVEPVLLANGVVEYMTTPHPCNSISNAPPNGPGFVGYTVILSTSIAGFTFKSMCVVSSEFAVNYGV
jgi:hypothetical protein